eukprot:scaffold81104_cov18-Tisochrysis_lutea.AAC.3
MKPPQSIPLALCVACQVGWEVNLFALYSRALTAGGQGQLHGMCVPIWPTLRMPLCITQVSAEDAARRAHANNLQRVGQGGLGEEEGQDAGGMRMKAHR